MASKEKSGRAVQAVSPVPPRVDKAIQLIQVFMQKAAPSVAAGPWGVDWHEGQELTPAECAAHAAAADCLEAYFMGKLDPDIWEALMIKMHGGADPDDGEDPGNAVADGPAPKKPPEFPFPVVPCGLCAGKPGVNAHCHLCKGCGQVALVPRNALQG